MQGLQGKPAAEESVERGKAQPETLPPLARSKACRSRGKRRIESRPLPSQEATFDPGNILAQAAKLRLRRRLHGHGGLDEAQCSLFVLKCAARIKESSQGIDIVRYDRIVEAFELIALTIGRV